MGDHLVTVSTVSNLTPVCQTKQSLVNKGLQSSHAESTGSGRIIKAKQQWSRSILRWVTTASTVSNLTPVCQTKQSLVNKGLQSSHAESTGSGRIIKAKQQWSRSILRWVTTASTVSNLTPVCQTKQSLVNKGLQSSHAENSGSRRIIEVKQQWSRSILRWVTTASTVSNLTPVCQTKQSLVNKGLQSSHAESTGSGRIIKAKQQWSWSILRWVTT